MRRWTAYRLGIACAFCATGLGVTYLAAAGAPPQYVAIQVAALGIGLASLAILARIPADAPEKASGLALVLLGVALLATALFGASVEGAARWVKLGAIHVQTSLIVLPAMLLLFARTPGWGGTIGIVLAALALALQPDRAMAGVLAGALVVLALVRFERRMIMAAACGLGAFAAALAQPDKLPAARFVDGVLYSAFDIHPVVGIAVVAGALMLPLPALGAGERDLKLMFGATWLAVVLAAALGNYPTPLVGYGGSAVLGYVLSVALLPKAPRARLASAANGSPTPPAADRNDTVRAALA